MFTLSDPANNKFDIWLKANGVFLAIGVAAALLIVVVVLLILSKKGGVKPKEIKVQTSSNLKDLVGGADNIISVSVTGSRISLELKDFNLLKEDELKSHGVLSFIRMSKKITLVCNKGDVESIYKALN